MHEAGVAFGENIYPNFTLFRFREKIKCFFICPNLRITKCFALPRKEQSADPIALHCVSMSGFSVGGSS
jgi:hypothetical protein